MKKIKKILSSIIATATLISGTCFSVSATDYDDCDVNRDSIVNVRDVSAISSYRASNVYVPNYSQLDADKNLVINSMDEQRVLAEFMEYSYSSYYYSKKNRTTSSAPTVSEFVSSTDDSLTTSRSYKKYNYSSKQVSNYTLSPSTTQLTSSAQSRGIIGENDLYSSYGSENSGIVYFEYDKGSSYSNEGRYIFGTGFIVGDHQIATAAHCVYNGDWYTSLGMCNYKYNGELNSSNRFTPIEVHVPNDYNPNDTDDDRKCKYDYALITVEEDLSGYIQFDLGTSYSVNATNFNDIPIHVTGCPEYTNTGEENTSRCLFTGEGTIMSSYTTFFGSCEINASLSNLELLRYNADTCHGNSGSPVYTITKNIVNNQASYTYTAIAIHNHAKPKDYQPDQIACNSGTPVTKYLLQFYKNNPNANY